MQYQPKSFLWCVRVASAAVAVVACQPALATPECPALLRHTFARLQDEKPQNLCEHAGKVVLVVNTASYCGFTGQYKGLEALYGRYRDQGLVVLGFPSNDFGQQEPGNAKAIADFCENTFGVKFPMLTKTVVSGRGANAFYKQLGQKTGEVPTWNFHKYLIDRSGQGVRSFPSAQDPASPAFVQAVEKLLAQK
jgi:glutathione peroxidase